MVSLGSKVSLWRGRWPMILLGRLLLSACLGSVLRRGCLDLGVTLVRSPRLRTAGRFPG